jgi:hypothetical protein
MSALDTLADKAKSTSERWAGQPGVKGKLAGELADDADFLRKLKPRLIKMRAKGKAPTDQDPDTTLAAPSGPQLGEHPKPRKPKKPGRGLNPFAVIGAALVLGVVTAKVIDWRGHAYPRW